MRYEGQLMDEEDEYFDDGGPYCERCDDTGEILVCPDDLCQIECIHGDGYIECPSCTPRA